MKPPWTIGRLILDSQGHEATLDYRKVDTGHYSQGHEATLDNRKVDTGQSGT